MPVPDPTSPALLKTWLRDFTIPDVPASGANEPDKAEGRAIADALAGDFGAVAQEMSDMADSITAAADGLVQSGTWAGLAAVAGTRAKQPGRVIGDDGTHVDPVTGLTVANGGEYAWSAAPAGWERIGEVSSGVTSLEYARGGHTYAVVDKDWRILNGDAPGAESAPTASVEYGRSGVSFAVVDRDYRIISGSSGGANATASQEYGRSGISYAVVDRDYRILVKETAPDPDTPEPPSGRSYVAFTADVSGETHVFSQDVDTGQVVRLSSAGSNNTDPVLIDDGALVRWKSDRTGDVPPGNLWCSPPAAAGEKPLVSISTKIFAGPGDSMSAYTYMSALAALMGGTVISGGVPGQTSPQIVARYGSVPALFTVTGNQIPASGGVAITAKSASPITSGSANGPALYLTLPGTLAGVHGVLSRDMGQPAGTDNLTFTRDTAGSAVPCPPNTPFIPDTNGNDECIAIPWMGANNPSQQSQILSDLEATVSFLKARARRFIVIGVINRPTATIGTAEHLMVTTLNAAIASKWPDNFFDVRTYLIGQYNPSLPDDVTAHNQDIMPPSLSDDQFHPNATAQGLLAQQLFNLMTAKGWL